MSSIYQAIHYQNKIHSMEFLTTPESRFENLPGYNFTPNYFCLLYTSPSPRD